MTELLQAVRAETLWSRFEVVAGAHSAKEALIAVDDAGDTRSWSYDELRDNARALAGGLLEIGVRRGDRLALWMTNRIEWVQTLLAAQRLGVVVVPVNTRLKPHEVAYVLGQSASRHLVLLDRFRSLDFLEMLAGICPSWPASERGHLYDDHLPELRTVVVSRRDGGVHAAANAFGLGSLAESGRHSDDGLAAAVAGSVRAADLAMIKYTSGSTSFPKGVMLEQSGLVANAMLHTERLRTTADDVWFNSAPFFHVGGSVWGLLSALVRGSTLVFTETSDAELALSSMSEHRCTVHFAVSTMSRDEFALLSEGREYDFGSLRISSAQHPDLAEGARTLLGVDYTFNPYGMTETYGPIALCGPDDSIERQSTTCGRLLAGVESRVVDPDSGADVEPGVVGELWLRGLVMRGYFGKPAETAAVLDEAGWFRTGDLASVDEDGYVRYVSRLDSMIKVGGENVAAVEIEHVLLACPDVRDCHVLGAPDTRLGHVPVAFVVSAQTAGPSQNRLRAWCVERLASFKVPRTFLLVDDLPRTGSGKIDRQALRRIVDDGGV